MPRLSSTDLNVINKYIGDKVESLHRRLSKVESNLEHVQFKAGQLDYLHEPPTLNNLVFTWHGGTSTITWPAGFIRDRNAGHGARVLAGSFLSSARGNVHTQLIPAGTLTGVSASTYYWLGWDPQGQVMIISKNVNDVFFHDNSFTICQLFTGTGAQTGVAGGGGSQSGIDLSGARYKLF